MDTVIGPVNRMEAMEQWTEIHGVNRSLPVTETIGPSIVHAEYRKNGPTGVETCTLKSMGMKFRSGRLSADFRMTGARRKNYVSRRVRVIFLESMFRAELLVRGSLTA
jgi:hypothetical protein